MRECYLLTYMPYTVSMTLSMYSVKKKTFISQHTCLIQQLSMVYLKGLSNTFQTPKQNLQSARLSRITNELLAFTSLYVQEISVKKKCAGGCPCIILLVFFLDSLKLPSTILKLDTGGKSASVEFRHHHHIFRQRVQ